MRGGTRAVLGGQLASQLISFLVLAVLYRLVDPDQFGLLGMAVPALLLARIVAAFGLNVATVQRKHLNDSQMSSLFWLNVVLGLAIAGLTTLAGPVLARLYAAPELAGLCAALSGTLVVTALGAQHQALLERRLRLGRLTAGRIIAQATGGGAAILAGARGAGVWALVVQQYVELVVLTALVWSMEPWRPGPPRRRQGAADLVRFGGYYSVSSLLFFVAQNADKILLAYWLGATRSGQAALGMYTQAFGLMMKPVYMVSTPVTGVMLPVLSRVVDQRTEFVALVGRFYRLTGLALLPAGIGLLVVGRDAMVVLGGTAWEPAGWMVIALAPTVLVQGFINIAGSVFAAAGRPGRLLIGATANAIVLSLSSAIGLWVAWVRAGAAWEAGLTVAWVYSAAAVLLVFGPYTVFCFRTAGVPLGAVFAPLKRPLAVALVMGILVEVVRQVLVRSGVGPPGRVVLTVGLGMTTFVALARQDLRWLLRQVGGDTAAET